MLRELNLLHSYLQNPFVCQVLKPAYAQAATGREGFAARLRSAGALPVNLALCLLMLLALTATASASPAPNTTATFVGSEVAQPALSNLGSLNTTSSGYIDGGTTVADASGNIWVSYPSGTGIAEFTASSGYTSSTTYCSSYTVQAVAVPWNGSALYFSDASGKVYSTSLSSPCGSGGVTTLFDLQATGGKFLLGEAAYSAEQCPTHQGSLYAKFLAVNSKADIFFSTGDVCNLGVLEASLLNGTYVDAGLGLDLPSATNLSSTGFIYGLGVDANDNVFAADWNTGTVFEYAYRAEKQYTVGSLPSKYITSLSVDPSGDAWVATAFENSLDGEVVEYSGNYSSGFIATVRGVGLNAWMVVAPSSSEAYELDGNYGTVELSSSKLNFGSLSVGSSTAKSSTSASMAKAIFEVTTAGNVTPATVVTTGQPNYDFTATAETSDEGDDEYCGNGTTTSPITATTSLSAGTYCAVNVAFTPQQPGLRKGAVNFLDGSGNIIASSPVLGIGVGPQAAFANTATSWSTTAGFRPGNMAVDAAGNVYAAANGVLAEISPSGTVTTLHDFGSSGSSPEPFSVAIDGAGNLFVSAIQVNEILECTAASAYATCNQVASGITFSSGPVGIALDSKGNLFVVDQNRALYEATAASGYTTVSTISSSNPSSPVAIDPSDNVYVVLSSGAIREFTASSSYTSYITLSGITAMGEAALAFDAAGDMYYIDSTGDLRVLPSGSTTSSILGTGFDSYGEQGMGYGNGVLYVTSDRIAPNDNRVVNLTTAPSLSFATTVVGTQSADSPQTVTLMNIGNATIDYSAPTISASYTLANGGTGDCGTSATTFASGSACLLPVSFMPTVTGSNSGTLVLSDNSLNAGASQTITLSGTGTIGSQAITFTDSLPALAYWKGVAQTYTLSAKGGGSGNAVTFTVDSTSTAAASISGSTLTITGTGTVVIDANQAGNADYHAAPQVQQNIVVELEPVAGISAASGTPQTAQEGAPFAKALQVHASGVSGDADYGATVTYTVTPASNGASATLSSSTATTDVNGLASVKATANGIAGTYTVTASVSNGSSTYTTTFTLTNTIPTFYVTTATDDAMGAASNCNDISQGATPNSACSLRDAIAAASATASAATPVIQFASSLGYSTSNPVTLSTTTGGVLTIGHNLSIVGPGANQLSISGGGKNQIVNATASNVNIAISGLTLTGGGNVAGGGAIYFANGVMTIGNCTFSGNTALYGGAIMIPLNGAGQVTITGSTFYNNSTPTGSGFQAGAVYNGSQTPAGMTIANSTFYNNTSNLGGAVLSVGYTKIVNSTFVGNTASSSGSAIINYPFNNNSSAQGLTLANNLIVGAVANTTSILPYTDGGGNVINTSVGVSALGYWGGTTQTVLPVPSSAALCAGTAANATAYTLTTDQRGDARTTTYGSNTCVDAGAVQTNYSLAFATSPASTQYVNAVLTPSPAATVQLKEQGSNIALANAPIAVALKSGAFTSSSTSTVTTAATGLASFPALAVSSAVTSDNLIASISAGSNSVTAASGSFAVIKTPTSILLSSNANPVFTGNALTFTATVAQTVASGAPAPSGTVSFYNGSTAICSNVAENTSGNWTCTTSSLAAANYAITATFNGDASDASSSTSSSVAETVADFNFTITNTSATVIPGKSAIFTFTVNPSSNVTSFPAAIALSVSGQPANATVTLSPSSINSGSGSTVVTLTLQTAAVSASLMKQKNIPGGWAARTAPVVLGLLLLPFAGKLRRSGKLLSRLLVLLMILAAGATAVTSLSGCGSSVGYFDQQQQTYTVTVTGTSGSLSHSGTVNLTIE
jgi:CSLREA domain-containing protein